MLNLDSTIELDIRKYWGWWSREILALMPERIRQLIEDKRGVLIIRPCDSALEVTYRLNGHVEAIGRFQRDTEGLSEFRGRLDKDVRLEKADILIRLTEQDAIAKKLVLPIAAAENLEQVAAYEIDRYTPFKAGQVYFAVKLLEKNKQLGQVSAMLVVSPKEKLDVLIEAMLEQGIQPLQADFEEVDSGTGGYEFAYNLLPVHLRKKTPVLPSVVHGGLTVLLCILMITALVLPVWLQEKTVEELRETVSKMEKDARIVDSLQKEADMLIAQTEQLIAKKRDQPSIVELLDELSRLINDDTWLTYLQFTNGRLQFQGQSPSASTLIGVLEGSPLFNNARFVSPVTQDPRSGGERFQITADVKARTHE